MALAELEVVHSRPIAPTRRVALGDLQLPTDPAPGFGAILLGGVVAANINQVDPDLHEPLRALMDDTEWGRRIAQPRVRHRFQTDKVGLQSSVHRLHGRGERLELELANRGAPLAQALGAIYAAGTLPLPKRPSVMEVLRRAMRWPGEVDDRLIAYLSGQPVWKGLPADTDPFLWARAVLDFESDDQPLDRRQVQARFRELLRAAHPDHGGAHEAAARRIAELAEARRILLA